MTNSVAILAATSSDPYVDVSTVFCLLQIHKIGVLFNNISIPVTDLLVTTSCAWSASKYTVILTDFPYGSGISGGNSSSTSGYHSVQSASSTSIL